MLLQLISDMVLRIGADKPDIRLSLHLGWGGGVVSISKGLVIYVDAQGLKAL